MLSTQESIQILAENGIKVTECVIWLGVVNGEDLMTTQTFNSVKNYRNKENGMSWERMPLYSDERACELELGGLLTCYREAYLISSEDVEVVAIIYSTGFQKYEFRLRGARFGYVTKFDTLREALNCYVVQMAKSFGWEIKY